CAAYTPPCDATTAITTAQPTSTSDRICQLKTEFHIHYNLDYAAVAGTPPLRSQFLAVFNNAFTLGTYSGILLDVQSVDAPVGLVVWTVFLSSEPAVVNATDTWIDTAALIFYTGTLVVGARDSAPTTTATPAPASASGSTTANIAVAVAVVGAVLC